MLARPRLNRNDLGCYNSDADQNREDCAMRKLWIAMTLSLVACSGESGGSGDQIGEDGGLAEINGEDLSDSDVLSDVPSDVSLIDIFDVSADHLDAADDIVPEIPDTSIEVAAETDGGDIPTSCDLDLDCPADTFCKAGLCQASPECADDGDCPEDLESCVDGKCLADGISPFSGAVRINELLSDGTTDEDANQDGSVDSMEDEFIEVVVVSNASVDVSGWIIAEKDWDVWLPRHTFPQDTVLSPLTAAVVFGGGDAPESTDSVLFMLANNADPGTPYGLDLNDDGDEVRLLDAEGLLVDIVVYGEAPLPASDQSLTRSPDLTGAWTPHLDATGAAGAVFSPGTRVDGSVFID